MDEPQTGPVRAQLANGDVLEFPPGTSEDVVTATVKRHIAERAPVSPLADAADTVKGVVSDMVQGPIESAKGIVKGIGQTAADVGKTANTLGEKVFGRKMLPEGGAAWADEALKPTNPMQAGGKKLEQIGEYLVPGAAADTLAARVAARLGGGALLRVGARSVAGGAANAGMAALHGEDPTVGAALGAVLPVAGEAAAGVGAGLRGMAPSLVRRGLKPAIADMRRIPGASRTGVNAQADALAHTVLENRLTTPEKASSLITSLEDQVQKAVQGAKNPTDAAQRAWDYLDDLASQAQTTDEVNTIKAYQQELLKGKGRLGGLSEDQTTTTQQPIVMNGKPLLNPQGQPITSPQTATTRVLRTDVSPQEALDLARNSSRWQTNKQWGEMKGADTEAAKTTERALRDSVKDAVPETRDLLRRQGETIRARTALDRASMREGNKSAVGLEGALGAAADTARGNFLGAAAQWLNRHQVHAGIYADALGSAIQRGDAQAAARIFGRLGIGVAEVYPQGGAP